MQPRPCGPKRRREAIAEVEIGDDADVAHRREAEADRMVASIEAEVRALLEELGYMPKHKYSFAPEILEHSRRIARILDTVLEALASGGRRAVPRSRSPSMVPGRDFPSTK